MRRKFGAWSEPGGGITLAEGKREKSKEWEESLGKGAPEKRHLPAKEKKF